MTDSDDLETGEDLETGGDLLLTVTSPAARSERDEFPSMRWFTAVLAREHSSITGAVETTTTTDLARCHVVLISLKYGLRTAYLDADAEDGSLAAVMEELLDLDRRHLLDRRYPDLGAVLIVDAITAQPEHADHNHEPDLLREVASYFDYLPGATLMTVFPDPSNPHELDRFTFRAQYRRIEALLPQLGMTPLNHSGAWAIPLTGLLND